MKRILIISLVFFSGFLVCAQDLTIGPADVRIEQSIEGGYFLYIRKKPDIESVLLTESTEDPNRNVATYALRNPDYHPENGNEKRILDGELLDDDLYSLIDSTPMDDERFDRAFRIYIPYMVEYGYSWTRSGEIMILDGAYLSVRAFSKKYADYSGSFKDNPFILRVTQKPLEGPPDGNYMPDTVNEFTVIAAETDGKHYYSPGEEDLVDQIVSIIEQKEEGALDLVLALDTTLSMQNDVPFLKKELVPLLRERTNRFSRIRIGMVFYRDYMEEYLTKTFDFEENLDFVQKAVDSIHVQGGRDLPEAVYEALYASVMQFPWESENRMVILVGDAPPHPKPRGSVTKELVYEEAKKRNVEINTIILPQ